MIGPITIRAAPSCLTARSRRGMSAGMAKACCHRAAGRGPKRPRTKRSLDSSPTAPTNELAAKYRKLPHDPDRREAAGEFGVAGPPLGRAVSTSHGELIIPQGEQNVLAGRVFGQVTEKILSRRAMSESRERCPRCVCRRARLELETLS